MQIDANMQESMQIDAIMQESMQIDANMQESMRLNARGFVTMPQHPSTAFRGFPPDEPRGALVALLGVWTCTPPHLRPPENMFCLIPPILGQGGGTYIFLGSTLRVFGRAGGIIEGLENGIIDCSSRSLQHPSANAYR